MSRTVPLSIIRSLSLYTQQWYMSYNSADSLRAGSGRNWFGSAAGGFPSWSCSQAVGRTVWHITFLCVQWKTPDDAQRNCPKHVDFYSKNKFEKLLHLVGFIIRKNLKDAVRGHHSNRIGCDWTENRWQWRLITALILKLNTAYERKETVYTKRLASFSTTTVK